MIASRACAYLASATVTPGAASFTTEGPNRSQTMAARAARMRSEAREIEEFGVKRSTTYTAT
jgi:hypothetical protein